MDPLAHPIINSIKVCKSHLLEMRHHVDQCYPYEACGIVAGKNGITTQVYPIHNELESKYRYRMAPLEQLHAFEDMEKKGEQLLAIFHSHPQGPDSPSPTDIKEAYYPDAVYLIWSKATGIWQVNAFYIRDQTCNQIPIRILE